MQAPKRKTSKSKRNMRRSHHAITLIKPGRCANCGESVLSHRVCPACGYYKGRVVIEAQA